MEESLKVIPLELGLGRHFGRCIFLLGRSMNSILQIRNGGGAMVYLVIEVITADEVLRFVIAAMFGRFVDQQAVA